MISFYPFLVSSGAAYLSFGDEVGHDGGVAKLGGQVDAAAALAVDQRRVCAVLHQLHHHGEVALSGGGGTHSVVRDGFRRLNKGEIWTRTTPQSEGQTWK